jgi:hypothetical protein
MMPADAARELQVSEKQLRALSTAGEIKYINIGLGEKRETRRYDPADLEEFKEARKCQSSRGPGSRRTPTTSAIVEIDFQARRNARRAATRSDSKRK